MARRRAPESQAGTLPIPPELQHRPRTPEEIAAWVGPDEEPSPGWGFGDAMWRVIRAHTRHNDARHAWCDEHGLNYRDTFHPRDPSTGHRDWSS